MGEIQILWQNHKKWTLFFLSTLLFSIFVFFSYLVHKNLFTHIDFDMTVRLQDHLPRRVDSPFSLLSLIGNVEVMSVILLVVFLIYRKVKTFLAFLFFAILHVFEIYGKTFVHHLPPPHFLLRTQTLVNFPQFYVSEQNSYPSGHSGRAFFLTSFLGVMTIHTNKLSRTKKVIIVFVLASYDITMGISRIYLGEHWTSDVLGGGLIGLSFGLLASILL